MANQKFKTWCKKKSQSFRDGCIRRAKGRKINIDLLPMPKEIELWLLTYQDSIICQSGVLDDDIYLPCHYTGELVKLSDIQIDHIIPISRGGSFAVANLAITSAKTNQYKGGLTADEFLKLLDLLNTFDDKGKNNVLSRLRSGWKGGVK